MLKKKLSYSLLILLTFLIIALFLRMLNLNKEFTGDEIILIGISQMDFNQILPALVQHEVYPPLTYIIIHFWMQLNQSELWIRLYFVLFGMGVCFLLYLIAKEYFDVKLARIVLLLSIFSPLLIFSAQYVRSYIDSAFWMLLSTLFMLKIIKGKAKLINWIGYIISVILSLYTFYVSALLILAQFIFIAIFKWQDKRSLLKWCFMLFLVSLAFTPWLPLAIRQVNNGSRIAFNWSSKGFNLGALRIGLYMRNIFSLIGFDPYFMVLPGGITRHFTKSLLAVFTILSLSIFVLFIYYSFRCLKIRFPKPQDKALLWFPFFLIFLPLFISWICAGLFNTLPNARYLVAFHGIFLIFISVFVYTLYIKKRLIITLFTIFIFSVFIIRIPIAVSVEFDTKSAISFLKENLVDNDCLICIRSCPPEGVVSHIVKTEGYFKMNEKKSEYISSSTNAKEEFKQKIIFLKRIWFYRVYGNTEVFGANRLLDSWLKEQGYNSVKIERFKNIDIVRYEK